LSADSGFLRRSANNLSSESVRSQGIPSPSKTQRFSLGATLTKRTVTPVAAELCQGPGRRPKAPWIEKLPSVQLAEGGMARLRTKPLSEFVAC
jgi:hypothetical protein